MEGHDIARLEEFVEGVDKGDACSLGSRQRGVAAPRLGHRHHVDAEGAGAGCRRDTDVADADDAHPAPEQAGGLGVRLLVP